MVCHYTGKEPSPKGRGICAHERREGDVEVGKDGNQWAVGADKNGRLFWKKISRKSGRGQTKRRLLSRSGKSPQRRAGGMQEAAAVVRALLADEELMDKYSEGDPDPDSVQFFPQAKMRLLWAREGSQSPKGYLIGQFGYAPSLGVVYWPFSERADVRPINQKEMEEYSYVGFTHKGEGLRVSGSGADPVFEIL